ncbi:MAG: glycosyltransferase family 4 protein [Candidatus Peribacteraceae bacterium]|nr:glycosyltransferase family 4 protein [Candidatus Peribacteraceae bacterium]
MRLVVVTNYLPEYNLSGIPIASQHLCVVLAKEYPSLQIELFGGSSENALHTLPEIKVHAVKVWEIGDAIFGLNYPLWRLSSLIQLWKSIKRCDAVHVYEMVYVGSIAAMIFASILNKPVILTIQGGILYRPIIVRLFMYCFRQTVGHWMMRQAKNVVTVSEILRKQIVNNAVSDNKISIIPNGTDTGIFHPIEASERRTLRRKLQLKDKFTVLFCGRFSHRKGLPLLHQLVHQLSEIQWIFAGTGPLDPRQWNETGVQMHVETVRNRQRLATFYQCADILILPSYGEGLPLVMVEAMACGTPVLTTDENAEAVHPSFPHIFRIPDAERSSADSWTKVLRKLMSEIDTLGHLQTTIAQYAVDHWKWSEIARHYHLLFSELKANK